jgi:hypothetical protein
MLLKKQPTIRFLEQLTDHSTAQSSGLCFFLREKETQMICMIGIIRILANLISV